MTKNLRNLLSKIANEPIKQQHDFLEKAYVDWVGTYKQVDDVNCKRCW